MKSKNVLIPVDLLKSSGASLRTAQELAAHSPLTLTLLYVLDLDAAVGPDIYRELCLEADAALRRLARHFFGWEQAVQVLVRTGNPDEEIVAQAQETPADLILLEAPRKRRGNWLRRRTTAEKVIDAAPCPALVIPTASAAKTIEPPFDTTDPRPREESLLKVA
jgi:nucleotide-binding universal stress UspA family protein